MTTPISSPTLSMFESIVNVKLLNIPLFIGVVLPMLLKYDTAELRFWLGSMGNVNNVWLRLPCLSKFFAELMESQLDQSNYEIIPPTSKKLQETVLWWF